MTHLTTIAMAHACTLLLSSAALAATLTIGPSDNLAAAIGQLRPGDTLYLKSGTYGSLDDTQMTIPSGTSWDAPVTIASAPGETAVIQGRVSIRDQHIEYVIFDRLTVDG